MAQTPGRFQTTQYLIIAVHASNDSNTRSKAPAIFIPALVEIGVED